MDLLSTFPKQYKEAIGIMSGLDYDATDIERFCIALADCQSPRRAMIFLSALINNGKEDEQVLRLSGDLMDVSFLCYKNMKRVIVHGDVGSDFAWHMSDGEILLHGNAGSKAGASMGGGRLIIEGDAGDFLGGGSSYSSLYTWHETIASPFNPMTGGTIVVNGDAGESVGDRMRGGEIHLNGEYGSIGHDVRGRIFHKGKLIAGG
jgi:formylmethanofuran dehydrogenase subunit C